jgi:hypothetical protein
VFSCEIYIIDKKKLFYFRCIFKTKDVKETAEYLGRATRALAENNWRAEDTFLSLIEVKTLKCGKKAKDYSPKDNFQQMLLQIPSILYSFFIFKALVTLSDQCENFM